MSVYRILNTVGAHYHTVFQYNTLLYRADSRFVPSQWDTVLLCNDVSHWMGASLQSACYSMALMNAKQHKPSELTSHPIAHIHSWAMASIVSILEKTDGVITQHGCIIIQELYSRQIHSVWTPWFFSSLNWNPNEYQYGVLLQLACCSSVM